MKKVSIKGVLIGSISDIVLTNILILLLIIYIIWASDFTPTSGKEMMTFVMDKMKNDQWLHAIQILLGSISSIIGGYIAARIAKHHEVLNGALASVFCVMFGVYGFSTGAVEDSEYIKHILLLISSPLLAMLGGYLRLKQVHKINRDV